MLALDNMGAKKIRYFYGKYNDDEIVVLFCKKD